MTEEFNEIDQMAADIEQMKLDASLTSEEQEELFLMISGEGYELYKEALEIKEKLKRLADAIKTLYGTEKKRVNYMIKTYAEQNHTENMKEASEAFKEYELVVKGRAPGFKDVPLGGAAPAFSNVAIEE